MDYFIKTMYAILTTCVIFAVLVICTMGNQADWTGSVGLHYHGLITGRDDDIARFAVTVNHAGDRYRRANDSSRHETDMEATYRIQVTPYFAVQPTV